MRYWFFLLACFLLLAGASDGLFGQSFPVLRWQKFFGTQYDDQPQRLLKALDGNLFVAGNFGTGNGESDCTDIWVAKVDTNGNQVWERRFGGSGCDELRDITTTPDSGVIFVGITNSFIEHPEKGQEQYQGDYFIGKITKDGEIEWLKTYGGLDVDQAYAITRSETAKEYMVAGASSSTNFDVQTDLQMANMWCLKVDDQGEKQSSWIFGGNRHDWAYSIDACKNGDYVFAGYTNSEDIDGTQQRQNGDGWVGRVDRYGSMDWQRIYSGKLEDYFSKVIESKDGRIILVGNFESERKGKQFWFLKLTPDGKKIYERIFGDVMDEYATSIFETEDGGFIMTGYSKYINLSNKYIKGGEDFWVFRLNARGDVIWTNTFGGRDDERGVDILEYSPGVYYALGVKRNNFSESGVLDQGDDFWLLRIDEDRCDDIDVQIYLSAGNYTAYTDKGIKFKAQVAKGERFLWDFGDGTTSLEREPVKKYDMPGVYEVKVTVFINENCSRTVALPKYLMVW